MKTLEVNAVELLCKFVNQRAGLEFCNYGDVSAYRSEQRAITKQRTTFYELLYLAQRRYGSGLNMALTKYLQATSGRLMMNGGKLEYCTGQYFPTEYRNAASRVLVDLIWANYRDEIEHNTPNPVYKDGHEIRKAINRELRSKDAKGWFK